MQRILKEEEKKSNDYKLEEEEDEDVGGLEICSREEGGNLN